MGLLQNEGVEMRATKEIRKELFKMLDSGCGVESVARAFGINRQRVYRLLRNRTAENKERPIRAAIGLSNIWLRRKIV